MNSSVETFKHFGITYILIRNLDLHCGIFVNGISIVWKSETEISVWNLKNIENKGVSLGAILNSGYSFENFGSVGDGFPNCII